MKKGLCFHALVLVTCQRDPNPGRCKIWDKAYPSLLHDPTKKHLSNKFQCKLLQKTLQLNNLITTNK